MGKKQGEDREQGPRKAVGSGGGRVRAVGSTHARPRRLSAYEDGDFWGSQASQLAERLYPDPSLRAALRIQP